MSKTRIAIVCPGRGTYTSKELGYLQQFDDGILAQIKVLDQLREEDKLPSIHELDSAKRFSAAQHLAGEHASALIFACSFADFSSIDLNKLEIVAITGNSMDWYSALACSGALGLKNAYEVIQTMGSMMQDNIIGGQVIYPIVDDNWQLDNDKVLHVETLLTELNDISDIKVTVSIHLGGYLVLAGNEAGVKALLKKLKPIDDRFPMRLNKHAAFHTDLMQPNSERGKAVLAPKLFEKPRYPMIDGRGHIWQPYATDLKELWDYTLGHQVTKAYDFTKAIEVTIKEFAPDQLVLLGPGTTLGGAIGQGLVKNNWLGMSDKNAFISRQKASPFLISMGDKNQRHSMT